MVFEDSPHRLLFSISQSPRGAIVSNFQDAVNITLKNEGGRSNDEVDPGGSTDYGISLRFLQENNIDINHDGLINGKDIDSLTEQEAISIYKSQFWDKLNIGAIKNEVLADKVFDLSVNMGGYQAIMLLQEALNLQLRIQIKTDGTIGPMTISAINNVNIPQLLIAYKKLAANFYQNLVAKKPALQKFLAGWLKRCNQ